MMLDKRELMTALENGEIDNLEEQLLAYVAQTPEDLDGFCMLCIYYIYVGDYKRAETFGRQIVERSPYTPDGYYNLATVMELTGRLGAAYKFYMQSFLLSSYEHRQNGEISLTEEQNGILQRVFESIKAVPGTGAVINQLQAGEKSGFGLLKDDFRSGVSLVGTEIEDGDERLFVARYGNWMSQFSPEFDFGDGVREKLELIREACRGTQYCYDGEQPALLPICSLNPENHLSFENKGKNISVAQLFSKHFNYFRVEGKTSVRADSEIIVGKPVILQRGVTSKRLVLSIFVDGLSQVFLDSGFEEYMPETYRFFKKGVICKNSYSTADWTYPSLASVITGMEIPGHMMIHGELIAKLPQSRKLFSQCFHDAGYYTAKVDGDWRATPGYGYHRGFDRILFQHQHMGMQVDRVVTDVIDQIETMKESSQFVWMSMGDLHDIADNLDIPAAVQARIPLSCRALEDTGLTSVKQKYSETKQFVYREQARRVDRELGRLYRFLEQEYRDEEMVVGLFADHGQGFMVKEGEHFLSDGRSKVAMMFRSDYMTGSVCEDYINIADYMPILSKLAGVEFDEASIDGKIPAFFGGTHPKEYVITETIHPGDPYYAVLHGKDYYFYFTSDAIMGGDGRIAMDTWQTSLTDADGNPVYNPEIEKKLCEMVLEHIKYNRIYS